MKFKALKRVFVGIAVATTVWTIPVFAAASSLPWDSVKKNKTEKLKKETITDEKVKELLFEFPQEVQRRNVPDGVLKNERELLKIAILGGFNDRCLVSYEGRKFLVPLRTCRRLEMTKIRFVDDLLKKFSKKLPTP